MKLGHWLKYALRCLLAVIVICTLGSLTHSVNQNRAAAFSVTTAGDGYVPIVYQGKIYNIFHHQSVASDPANPKYDINCTDPVSEASCPSYPRFFSSTAGSTGRLSFGTPGAQDINTSNFPNDVIIGSQLFYAANRANDNGLGCFDLDQAINCGYTSLGSLPTFSGGFGFSGQTDGVEQVGNKLYLLGIDMKMYCANVITPTAPVACAGQPYSLNTGITSQLPAQNGNLGNKRLVLGTRIYTLLNYIFSTPIGNARISCFDTITNARCAGWSTLIVTQTSGNSVATALFEYPDSSGNVNVICAAQTTSDPVQCWNINSQASVTPPPNLFIGISRPIPVRPFQVLRIGLKSYFAVHVINPTSDGLAVCYDFSITAPCAGFGSNGIKLWNGADGGAAINNGDTRDYGYAVYKNDCLVGLGDTGVMWGFNASTGFSLGTVTGCTPVYSSSIPTLPTKLPNTGLFNRYQVPLVLGTLAMIAAAGWLAWRRYGKAFKKR